MSRPSLLLSLTVEQEQTNKVKLKKNIILFLFIAVFMFVVFLKCRLTFDRLAMWLIKKINFWFSIEFKNTKPASNFAKKYHIVKSVLVFLIQVLTRNHPFSFLFRIVFYFVCQFLQLRAKHIHNHHPVY